MAKKLLFEKIEYNEEKYEDWRQVVDYVGAFFAERGYASKDYFEYVKKDLEENEAYMVLVPHIVLLHSMPDHGAMKNAFHFMKLRHPVVFEHECNDPVQIVITFSCVNVEEHLNSIQKLGYMLLNQEFVSRIFEMETEEELKDYLRSYETL